ncbi:MAG: ArsI/CadI family heavy metal resistance metalloenzyme [Cyclobacteriaceae bacterium]
MSTFPKMHVSLYVHNIAETVNFYTSFFSVPAEKVKADYAKYILDKPALIISFVQNSDRVNTNFGHLGFQVETKEQLEVMLRKAKENKFEILEETETNCCYALQDKFWVKDPNGVQWEVYYFHEDVAFNDPIYSNESNEVCCIPEQKESLKVKLADAQNNSCDPGSGCC